MILFFGELSSRGPFGWCCISSSLLLGGAAFLPVLQPTHKRGEGKQHTDREEEGSPFH